MCLTVLVFIFWYNESLKVECKRINSVLGIYETYELLWNIRHQDYMNKNKIELSFEKVVARSSQNGAGTPYR
jgi:hypothetical protein